MNKLSIVFGALVMGSLGCAGAGSTAQEIRTSDWENQTLFFDPAVAPHPVDRSLITDFTTATPVRMEFLQDFAVAWAAPNDVPVFSRESLIGGWSVEDSGNQGGGRPTGTPNQISNGSVNTDTTGGEHGTLNTPPLDTGRDLNTTRTVYIDWDADKRREQDLANQVQGLHPGCL